MTQTGKYDTERTVILSSNPSYLKPKRDFTGVPKAHKRCLSYNIKSSQIKQQKVNLSEWISKNNLEIENDNRAKENNYFPVDQFLLELTQNVKKEKINESSRAIGMSRMKPKTASNQKRQTEVRNYSKDVMKDIS